MQVLSTYNGQIVAAREGHLLAASFHPELTDDYGMHAYFIDMVKERTQGHLLDAKLLRNEYDRVETAMRNRGNTLDDISTFVSLDLRRRELVAGK